MLQGMGAATFAPRALLMSFATFSQASAFLLENTTLAACSASLCTMASPMPLVEPVTSATFPLKSKSDIVFSLAGLEFLSEAFIVCERADDKHRFGQAG